VTDNPKVLGRYEIVAEISRGMMGVVYRAVDPVLGRTVALKTVNIRLAESDSDRGSFEDRFMTEARAAALLSHPAIVTVHDLGRDPESGILYIALEHLEGRTLADVVQKDGPLPWRHALTIAGRMAGALDHAHERGIIHRDVKPANIMVLPGGDVKLMDFGIAKIDATDLTAPGDFLGTPSYMSPEQASGTPLDGRSDIFSLGAVLYLMLTGRRPFDAPTVPGVMARVVSIAPDPLDVRDLPSDVDHIVGRCLEKLARARYARAREVEEDIEDVLAARPPRHRPRPAAEPVAVKPGIGDAVIGAVSRLRWRALAAILALLAFVGLASAVLRRPGSVSTPIVALPSAIPVPSPIAPTARLDISVRHPFRMATVRVWVDGVLAVEEKVPGRVTRNLLAVKLRRGTYKGTVDVQSGDRAIVVQVDDGSGFRESRRIRGAFASGEPRVLEAAVDGVVSKDMKLAWGR